MSSRRRSKQYGAWCCLIPCDELALRGRLTWSTQSVNTVGTVENEEG